LWSIFSILTLRVSDGLPGASTMGHSDLRLSSWVLFDYS
jgi:hypothetical protein